MTRVDVETAKEHLTELAEQAASGEEIILTREERPLARIVPLRRKRQRRFGSAKGLLEMADDFDAPLEDFRDYM